MLYVVGIGPGGRSGMTLEAFDAIEKSDIVVGYTVYTRLLGEVFPDKEYLSTSMGGERERVRISLEKAEAGLNVSLICSGDSAVYGMAALVYELAAGYPEAEIEIISGVTAALSGGAILGAPLTNDFAVISLSDILTPWNMIERRLEGAAMADFVIALYNPSSKRRSGNLRLACDIMLRYKPKDTVCGYVQNVSRNGERSGILTLSALRDFSADMFTTVFVGCSETRIINGKMVTPRGYRNE